jgi:hypothetical protein
MEEWSGLDSEHFTTLEDGDGFETVTVILPGQVQELPAVFLRQVPGWP